jgi:hypothetical protein
MAEENGNATTAAHVQADAPISGRAEDRLNRATLADAIAQQVIHGPPDLGFVIGLIGPWGSGKTSVLNMTEEAVRTRSETVVVRFNPWLFSSTEQLAVRFMQELGAQFRGSNVALLRDAAQTIFSYAAGLAPLGWVPVAGGWLSRVGTLSETLRARLGKEPSAQAQREKISQALRGLDRRVLVIVDDIDRVDAAQIRDVVRLIKLVGDFPNTTYLLAYDEDVVARAIDNDRERGREYLEKIVQVTHHLPEIAERSLTELLAEGIDSVVAEIETGPAPAEDLVNIFYLVLRPFFTTMRDVRRYLNALPVTLRVIGAEVALGDVVALEALRIFAPAAYAKLPGLVETLTTRPALGVARDEGVDVARITAMVEAAGDQAEAVKTLLARLFPGVGRYVDRASIITSARDARKERRVSHVDVLNIYLRRSLPLGTAPAPLVEEAFASLADGDRLAAFFEALDDNLLEDVLERLEDYIGDFDPAWAEPAIPVLYGQAPRLRVGSRGIFEISPDIQLTRVVLRLLERFQNDNERADAVRRIIPEIPTLSGKIDLVGAVGHEPNIGHGLVPQNVASELEGELLTELKAVPPDQLATERSLGDVLGFVQRHSANEQAKEYAAGLFGDDHFMLALLRQTLGERRSQTVGDVAVRSVPSLPWDWLTETFGERLPARIAELEAAQADQELDARTRLALQTATRYVRGELPLPDREL